MKRSFSSRQLTNTSSDYPGYIQNMFQYPKYQYNTSPSAIQREILNNYDSVKYPLKGRLTPQNQGDSMWYDPPKSTVYSPDEINPTSLTHEVMHADDHQNHNLYKDIWNNIETYATKNNVTNWSDLNDQLKPIQNKIDPTKAFSKKYPLDSNYLTNDINAVIDILRECC